MRLALSSAAAPGAPLEELLEAAARRGLAAVELVERPGHGWTPDLVDTATVAVAAERAAERGLAIAGFRLLGPPAPGDRAGIRALNRVATALQAPLLVALAPSSARYRLIWDAWLGRKGGWGCGSRSEDRTLVTLGGAQ